MLIKRKNFDVISLTKYLLLFVCYLVFSNVEKNNSLFSLSVFISSIFCGANIFISILLETCTVLLFGRLSLFLSLCSANVILIGVYIIYKKYNLAINMEIIAFTLLSLIPYIFIGDTMSFIPFSKRILYSLASSVLAFTLFKSVSSITSKGLKYKYNYEELVFLAVSVVLFGLGLCNLLSPLIWKSACLLIILCFAFIYKMGLTALISSILGLSVSIYYTDITFVAIFLLLSISVELSMPLNRYLSACSIILCDYVIFYFFKGYSSYTLLDFFSSLIPALIYSLIPTKLLVSLKDKLYLFREKQLSRQAINRNRIMLSNKLYDLSGVFMEIASAFADFNKKSINEQKAKAIINKEVSSSVCASCSNKSKCPKTNAQALLKIIDVGIAKSKLTLIDFPKELCETCSHSNEILFCLNKQLTDYRKYLLEQMNVNVSRDLIKEETLGIADILKGLAIDCGTTLKFQSKKEREISKKLFENGIIVSELLIYGEGKKTTVSIVISMKEFSISRIQNVLFETIGYEMEITEKVNIDVEKCYLSFKICCDYDAVFGLSTSMKNGSTKSGDTHTVTRIKDDKFLIALSDGMGSGETAEKVSSSSLSLIETFYKAGLKDQLILSTINKLLNINCEDVFTALDVAIIDLKECSTDFIKYGSPYSFILNKDGIKIVEGNTLPLGILEDLKPYVAHTKLNDRDMLLLCTDGVSDAFGSSGDMIDFLRTLPILNPQSLTDSIVKKAIELNGGKSNDDMTALAVRIFRKTPNVS